MLCTGGQDVRQDTVNRLNELALLKCDPRQEIRAIEANLRPNRDEEKPPDFGIGIRQTFQMRMTNRQPQMLAYRATRFSELAGLPPYRDAAISPWTLSADILKSAAEEVAGQDMEMAVRLVLRSCRNDDATLEKVLSRTRVATLTPQKADVVAAVCERLIEASRGHVVASNEQQRNAFWTERMGVGVEVLARLVLRLESDRAETILKTALEYYEDPQLARHRGLAAPIRNLLEYSWKSLPKEYRYRHIFDLLNAPIVGLDNLLPRAEFEYAEPVSVLAESGVFPPRTADNEGLWQATINLVIRGLNGSKTSRGRASLRVWYLIGSKLMAGSESKQIAEALL